MSEYRTEREKIEMAWRQAERNVAHGPVHRKDKRWDEYPVGTRAHSFNGGYWVRVEGGWKWFNGDTFPSPGADAFDVSVPTEYVRGDDGECVCNGNGCPSCDGSAGHSYVEHERKAGRL